METFLARVQEHPLWKGSIERIFPDQQKLPVYLVASTELFDSKIDFDPKNTSNFDEFVRNVLMMCRSPPVNPEYARACIESAVKDFQGRTLWLAMTWQHFVRDVRNDYLARMQASKQIPTRQAVVRLINKHLPYHLYGFLTYTEHAKSVHAHQPLVRLDLVCAAYLWRQGKRFHEHDSPDLKNPAIQHLLQPPPIRGRVGDALLCAFLLSATFHGYMWCALEVAVPADEKHLKHYGQHRDLPSVARLMHRYSQYGFVEIKALATQYQLFSSRMSKFPSMICHLQSFKQQLWWLSWFAIAMDPSRMYGVSPSIARSFLPSWLLPQKKKKKKLKTEHATLSTTLEVDLDDYACAEVFIRSLPH